MNNTPLMVLVVLMIACISERVSAEYVPEPQGFRTEEFLADVPATLKGAKAVHDPTQLVTLIEQQSPLLIDVYPAAARPKAMRKTELWIEPTRDTLPGAYWVPNLGRGLLDDPLANLLTSFLNQHTESVDTAIVIFCEPRCWHSWNAAKRAVLAGYQHVYWYSGGVSKWREAGFELINQSPVRP